MKSIKLFFVNALTLLIGVGLLTGIVSGSRSPQVRLEKLPELEVQGLGNYKGQYLTVFYAVGARPFIFSDNSKINLTQVKESRSVFIGSEKIRLAATEIEKEGFRPSYNMVVFVVSPNPDFTWVNQDGNVPPGVIVTANQTATFINAVDKATIDDKVDMDQRPKELLAINLLNEKKLWQQ